MGVLPLYKLVFQIQRLGYRGEKKRKRKLNNKDLQGGEERILQFPRLDDGIKVLQRRQLVQKMHARVNFSKLWQEDL
jgi:hypothetical protein